MCDGDTKAVTEIQNAGPREVAEVIEAVLDLNHVSKNLGKMLREMGKQWKEISQVVAAMLQARFDSAIRHARDDLRGTPKADAVLVLQARTRAVVNHCFGDHTKCVTGMCPAKADPSYKPTGWPRNKYLEDRAITITVCDATTGSQSTVTISLEAEVRKIFDQYTGTDMCQKLLHDLSSNLPEARHAMMWCMHSSKTTFNPSTLHTQWLSTQLHADLGRNAAVDVVQKSLRIARMRSVVAAARRKADLGWANGPLPRAVGPLTGHPKPLVTNGPTNGSSSLRPVNGSANGPLTR